MNVSFSSLADALRMGVSASAESSVPVRVAVLVDAGASSFIVDAVRGALVPHTTTSLVRVAALTSTAPVLKDDTDVALVLQGSSQRAEAAARAIAISGVPAVVLAESCVEAPSIERDTPLLGLVCATDSAHLLNQLSHWILDRTDKGTAFAAAFPFMRVPAAYDVVRSCCASNMLTGALAFVPGADYPVMCAAEVAMMLKLSHIFGKRVSHERAYDAVAICACGALLRAIAKRVAPLAGRASFVVKAGIAGAGTAAVGCALSRLYQSDFSYERLDEGILKLVSSIKSAFSASDGAVIPDRI